MIPDEQVEEVRARADLVDLIGEAVPLKRSGKDFKGRCPFHEERTPSFYVVPAKGIYNCFGCGESGDVFSFFMKRMGMDFLESVRHVAGRVGVTLTESRGNVEEEDRLRPLREANHFARDFFRERLLDPVQGKEARAYLEGRGIGPETWERFGIGYAPKEWRALRDAAGRHGMEEETLAEVGLLGSSPRSPEAYDRFRNRIIFPIEALGGQVVAFGGRVVGDGDPGAPKYLNSPETPLYTKGRLLYGLHTTRHAIRRDGNALVVEGYLDLVALAAHGVEPVVAALGTALTREQAELLRRYSTRALLLFDSDEAGLRATFRAGDVMLSAGMHPLVVTLPPGDDPDSLVRREGAAALEGHLDQAMDLLDRKLQLLEERSYFSSIDRIRMAVDRLLPTLRATADPTLRDLYVSRVAERTGVRRETLEEEIRATPAPAGGAARGSGPGSAGATRTPDGPRRAPIARAASLPPSRRRGAERKLLILLLRDRSWIDRAAERVGPDDFTDTAYRRIFQALRDDPEMKAPPIDMDPGAARRLEELLSDPEEMLHAARVFEDTMARLLLGAVQREVEELDRRLRATADPVEQSGLLQEKNRLRQDSRSLVRQDRPAAGGGS